jgi:hypothetical protein
MSGGTTKSQRSNEGENAMDLGLQDKHAIVTGGRCRASGESRIKCAAERGAGEEAAAVALLRLRRCQPSDDVRAIVVVDLFL